MALKKIKCERKLLEIYGALPIGGLSSGASVIIAFLSVLASVNGSKLESWETIMQISVAFEE